MQKTESEQGMIKNLRWKQKKSVRIELNDSLFPFSQLAQAWERKTHFYPEICPPTKNLHSLCVGNKTFLYTFSSAPVLLNGFVFISQYHGCNRCLSHSQRQTQMDCNEKDGENRKPSYILALKDAFFLSATRTVGVIAPTVHKGIEYVQLWNGRGAVKPVFWHPVKAALAIPKYCLFFSSV